MKILSLFIAAVLSCSTLAQEVARTFSFGADGKFRVCHLTDIQDVYPMKETSRALIRRGLQLCRPDLIILTGDNTCVYSQKDGFEKAISEYVNIFLEEKIPFAVTFGNHDSQQKGDGVFTRQEQYDIFKRLGGQLFVDFDVPELTGVGSGVIPLYADGKAVFELVIMDSGDYAGKGYDGCHGDQIRWYEEQAGTLPCLWFQHIIVPDINRNGVFIPVKEQEADVTLLNVQEIGADEPESVYSEELQMRIKKLPDNAVWSKPLGGYILSQPGLVWISSRGKYYIQAPGTVWNEPMNAFVKLNTALATGSLAEQPCPPVWEIYTDEEHTWQGRTLYQSWLKMGNLRGAFFGHDHMNTFDSTDANGIRIGYTKGITTYSYNDGNPGFRLFDIFSNGTFRTEILTARQLALVK